MHTDVSVRSGITREDICRLELPVPPIDEQFQIAESYKAITERIAIKKQIKDNLQKKANTSTGDVSFVVLHEVSTAEAMYKNALL